MLPEAFRDCRVQRLALFFHTFRDTLRAIAPRNRDNPRIVLLTPGPYNETYFEHAYLARYLGYTLVEGGDLTVRDNRVYLKVLGGLQPVDVIFRRLDDDFCDPLELRPDSFLGVPGLVQAVRGRERRGGQRPRHRAAGNARAAGVPARALPGAARRRPAAAVGADVVVRRPGRLRYVLDHLATLVVKPAFPASRIEPVFPAELSAGRSGPRWPTASGPGRGTSSARSGCTCRRPRSSTATGSPPARGAPGVPRRRTGTGSRSMPGGLTRVSASADTLVVSMQRGGGSKDTWVLSDGPVSDFSLLRRDGCRSS